MKKTYSQEELDKAVSDAYLKCYEIVWEHGYSHTSGLSQFVANQFIICAKDVAKRCGIEKLVNK